MRDTFNTLGVSEEVTSRVTVYFLRDEAKEVHTEHFPLVEVDFYGDAAETSDQGLWPYAVNAFLMILLTEDVPRESIDEVDRANQGETKMEKYSRRGS